MALQREQAGKACGPRVRRGLSRATQCFPDDIEPSAPAPHPALSPHRASKDARLPTGYAGRGRETESAVIARSASDEAIHAAIRPQS